LLTAAKQLDLAMRRGSLERAVSKRDSVVVAKHMRRFLLHDLENSDGEPANFRLGVTTAAQLDEMPQSAGVGGHENLGFRGVGQNTAGSLTGQLAAERAVRFFLESFLQLFGQLHVSLMAVGN